MRRSPPRSGRSPRRPRRWPALLRASHDALERGDIAGAGLDVFQSEPLPAQSPLWDMKNVIVSPHVSGEFEGYEAVVADLFVENVRRYMSNEPLLNVIDKTVGFVPNN